MNQAIAVVLLTKFGKAWTTNKKGQGKMFKLLVGCGLSLLLHFSCFAGNKDQPIHQVLDAFHQAAADANANAYFALLAEQAVFIGTDASERWSKQDFESFAKPYFDAGKGWRYIARDRFVTFSKNRQVAWFDEMLDNQSYGECRGTGVLQLTGQGWKISQYHLTIPMPNALAKSFVDQIKQHQQAQ